jgi:hypothetical protein
MQYDCRMNIDNEVRTVGVRLRICIEETDGMNWESRGRLIDRRRVQLVRLVNGVA